MRDDDAKRTVIPGPNSPPPILVNPRDIWRRAFEALRAEPALTEVSLSITRERGGKTHIVATKHYADGNDRIHEAMVLDAVVEDTMYPVMDEVVRSSMQEVLAR